MLLNEITAYKSGAGADWIVLTMVDHRTAFGDMGALADAIASGERILDIRDMAQRVRAAGAERS